jgi:putative Mn2+ efflux pump MntP
MCAISQQYGETAAESRCEIKEESKSIVRTATMNISAKRITLTLPEIGLIALTRGALGVGIGLVLSNVLEKNERRSAGLALLAVGALTTVPILLRLRNELK